MNLGNPTPSQTSFESSSYRPMSATSQNSTVSSSISDVSSECSFFSNFSNLGSNISNLSSSLIRKFQYANMNNNNYLMGSNRSSRTGDSNYKMTVKGGPKIEGSLKILAILDCGDDVLCCQFSVDGSHLAVGLKDGTIKIYDTKTQQQLYQLCDTNSLLTHLPVTHIKFCGSEEPDCASSDDMVNILAASYASGHVKLWHYPSSTCLHTFEEPRQTLYVQYRDSRLLTTGSDARIHVYDINSCQQVNTCQASDTLQEMDGHRFRVFTAQYQPDHNHVFLTGGWDNTIQFWDDRKPHAFRHFFGPHICGDSLSINPLNNNIVTGSWRRTDILQLWEFNSGRKITNYPLNMYEVSSLYCTKWLGNHHIVSGGSNSNMVQVHDINTYYLSGKLSRLPKAVYCMDHSGGFWLEATIAAGLQNSVYLMKNETSRIIEE